MSQGHSVETGSNDWTQSVILVVEDNLRTRSLEKFVLQEEGFHVEEAGSGEEGLQALATHNPALVLLDIGLPGMDGFATCQRIRELSQVPIIMVTAEDKDDDKARGLELGADDYVTKPFSTTELAARVKAVLRRVELTAIPKPTLNDLRTQDPQGGSTPDASIGAQVPSGTASTIVNETDELRLYEGTVKLVVETTGCIRIMIHFVDELRQNSEFHLLRLVANQHREGMDILLRLREPIRLKPTLLQMTDVSQVHQPTQPLPDTDEQQLHVSLGE